MRACGHFLARCTVALILAAAAHATTLQRMSLEDLVAASAVVVRARALASECRWEGGHIWTLTTLEVTETLKGPILSRLQVRLIGGRVGSLTSTVEGAPRFRSGEEVYLFLVRSPAGEWTVTAWALGTFRVVRDARSGQESVTQDAGGVTLFDPATRTFHPGGSRRMPVEEFRRQVSVAMAKDAGKSK